MRKAVLISSLFAVASSAACRPVMVVKFQDDSTIGTDVDPLDVGLDIPTKNAVTLHSVHQTVGFYEVQQPTVTITACGYVAGELKIWGQKLTNVESEITVELNNSGSPPDCPVPHDGGIDAHVQSVKDAAADADANAGADADVDAGSSQHDGGCDDGGSSPTCSAPTGDAGADQGRQVMVSTACQSYCDEIFSSVGTRTTLCPGIYSNIGECQRYCALVWGDSNGQMSGDSLDCRKQKLEQAKGVAMSGGDPSSWCTSAGPASGQGGQCGLPCAIFCNALNHLCSAGSSDAGTACMDQCVGKMNASSQEPNCRFDWLRLAASDQRYCDSVAYTSTCTPPACVGP
jgi:hypothetical protein